MSASRDLKVTKINFRISQTAGDIATPIYPLGQLFTLNAFPVSAWAISTSGLAENSNSGEVTSR